MDDFFNFGKFNDYLKEIIEAFEISFASSTPRYFEKDDLINIFDYYKGLGEYDKMKYVVELGKTFYPDCYIFDLFEIDILLLDGNRNQALRILNRLKTIKNLISYDDRQFLTELAEAFKKMGLYKDAIRHFEYLLTILPKNFHPTIYKHIASFCEYSKNLSKASNYLLKIVYLNPSLDFYWHEFIKFCNGNKFYNKGIKEIEKFLPNAPLFDYLWNELAKLYERSGKYRKAADAYEKAVAIDPSNLKYLEDIAYFYHGRRKYKDAIFYFSELLIRYKHCRDYRLALAECLYGMKKYKTAIEVYSDLLNKDDDTYLVHLGLAKCYFMLKEYKKALSHIKHLEDPSNVLYETYYLKACILAELKDYNKATKTLKLLLTIYNDIDIYLKLSEILDKHLNKPDEAIDVLKTALEESYDIFKIFFRLSCIYYENKRVKEGARALELAFFTSKEKNAWKDMFKYNPKLIENKFLIKELSKYVDF